MLGFRVFGVVVLLRMAAAAHIATWAWSNMMQLAMVKDGKLLMGTCSNSKEDWVFNQTLDLPSDFMDGGHIDIFYRQAEGGNFTGLIYQSSDSSIRSAEYACDGVNVMAPKNTKEISQKAGATIYDIKPGTAISVQTATVTGLLSIFYQGVNGSALMAYGAYAGGDFVGMSKVTPMTYWGNGITTSQYDDTYQVAFYAHNNTQFFYSTGGRGNGSWDMYGYPNSIQDNATNTDTYGPDFLNTNKGVDVDLSDYDVNYSDLAVTYDPLGPSGLWFFYLASNGLNIFSNVGSSSTDVTADPGDTELPTDTFAQRYSGWSSVNRTIGISAYTDVLRNYSRAYWVDSKDNVVYIERDGSDTANVWSQDMTTVEFTGSGKTATDPTGSGSGSSGTSSGLSTGAKIGIGAGVGCAGVFALVAIALFLMQRRKAAKAAKNIEATTNPLVDPSVCSPSVSPGIMKTPHELMSKESPVPTASPGSLGGAWSPAPVELEERREAETHEMMGDVPTPSELSAVKK